MIPDIVLDVISAVRCSGVTNMLDRKAVMNEAILLDNTGAAYRWMRDNKDQYMKALEESVIWEEAHREEINCDTEFL